MGFLWYIIKKSFFKFNSFLSDEVKKSEIIQNARKINLIFFLSKRLKSEIDQLFVEVTVGRPEPSGYKSDGPVRKLQMLKEHWRSIRSVLQLLVKLYSCS